MGQVLERRETDTGLTFVPAVLLGAFADSNLTAERLRSQGVQKTASREAKWQKLKQKATTKRMTS